MPDEIPHDAQITPAHTYELVRDQVLPEIKALKLDVEELKATVKEAGLNGHTPYLKEFLEDYAQSATSKKAWQRVRADVKHHLRFLAPGKHWLTVLLSAILGGVGWQIASGHVPMPHIH